ncbi:MAG: hypothetical protein M3295_00220 [Chloroflexota bacterium]|nr:hypothetical protein [Chloroflexota bacterium]
MADARTCIKCGRAIGRDETVCEICNRAGMQTPSATQYHGTIVVAIVAGVAALAVAASLSIRGIGPFVGAVVAVSPARSGSVDVTLEVTNEGSRAGRASCLVVATDGAGRRLATRTAETPIVDAGARIVVSEQLTGLAGEPARVEVDCE